MFVTSADKKKWPFRYDKVFQWIDRSCGVDATEDYDLAIKVRLLMVMAGVGILTMSVILGSAHGLTNDFTRSMWIGWVSLAILFLIPFLMIATKGVFWGGLLFSTTSLTGVIAACFLNGGLTAHFLINLPLVAVVVGWLLGSRAGLAAGAISLGAIVFMASPAAAPWISPSALTADQQNIMRTVTAISALFTALIIVHCFRMASTHALASIKTSRDAAANANKAKSEFLANMSHELRTPLNGVIAVAGTLDKTELTPTQREMVELIATSGKTLERLLTDVLDVSKIEAGRLDIEQIEFDLKQTIQSTVDLFRPVAQEKGVSLEVNVSRVAAAFFLGDPTRIRQIVSNLLSNAIKFTSEGIVGVSVDIENDGAHGQAIHMTVVDTGVGFDASLASSLFDRFTQEDSSINRRFGGSGLGLFICKSLVDAMGGQISAESRAGEGARFEVWIPAVRTQDTVGVPLGQDAGATAIQSPVTPSRHGMLSILLVEDHPTNRKIVELILGPLNVAMTCVENGAEAVRLFEDNSFDLILMDMQMPVMDGITATKKIRQVEEQQERQRTPIAMLTANAMTSHVRAALDAGADRHIAKPLTPERLIADVSELLESSGHAGGLAA